MPLRRDVGAENAIAASAIRTLQPIQPIFGTALDIEYKQATQDRTVSLIPCSRRIDLHRRRCLPRRVKSEHDLSRRIDPGRSGMRAPESGGVLRANISRKVNALAESEL